MLCILKWAFINFVVSSYAETGEALVRHSDKIIFIGSPGVGRMVCIDLLDYYSENSNIVTKLLEVYCRFSWLRKLMSFVGDENGLRDFDTSDIGTWWEGCIYRMWGCECNTGMPYLCRYETIPDWSFIPVTLLFKTGCSNCRTSSFTVKWTKLCWSREVLCTLTHISTFCKRDRQDSEIRQSGTW